jgi:hypothetical protein
MDTLTMAIVVALIGAIILFEIDKRERAKVTRFFNGNKMSLLIAADKKVEAILNIIDNLPVKHVNTGQYLSNKLAQLTSNYENSDITLSEYHAGLDELLGNQFAMPSFHLLSEGYYN